ncbi:MAG: LysR substrate-binding domain-containing protein [Dongiaceae bacterium]
MNRNIPTDLMRSFVTVIDMGTVTRAAAALGRSQPAVTLQMQRLEELLDHRLLAWDGRRTRPTPTGERLLRFAREILRLNDEAVDSLAQSTISGHVKIGTPNDFATTFLPRVLGRFADRHADVSLEVVCELSRQLIDMLHAQPNNLDIVLAMQAERPAASVQNLWKEELTWVGSTGHALSSRRPLPLVAYPEGCIYRDRMEEALHARKIPWRITYTSPSLSGIRAAVDAGLGVTVLAKSTVPPDLSILRTETGLPPLRSVFIALHRRRGRLSPAAAKLREFLVESLNDRTMPLN